MYIYIHAYIHTLTGHFIRYTLLVPGWTHFCLQNCLNSSWHRFNKVLETFLRSQNISRMCRFVGCTFVMRISRSTASQRCSIGLRSDDCGGHLSKVNSLSCSRNFSASLLHSSMHGPSEIILICWFIINVGNSCAVIYWNLLYFLGVHWSIKSKKKKKTAFILNRDVF